MVKTTPFQFSHSLSHNSFSSAKNRNRKNNEISQVHAIAESTTPPSSKLGSPEYHIPGYFKLSSCLSRLDLCTKKKSLDSVKQMHTQIIKFADEELGVDLQNRLIGMYAECGEFGSAAMVFHIGFEKNVLSLNSSIQELEKEGQSEVILEIFRELRRRGMVLCCTDLAAVLRICSNFRDLWVGKEIHSYAIKSGFDSDVYLVHALMDFYSNCCSPKDAHQVFDETPVRNVLLWNEALMVNFRNGLWNETLELFRRMQVSYAKADEFTISRVLQACSRSAALLEGKQVHCYAIRSRLASNLLVANSLIGMYTKIGKLKPARQIFDLVINRSLVSWNSMISGYALNGFLDDAWDLLHKMGLSETKPDLVTWNCLISGYSFHGSIDQVLQVLDKMQAAGFKPNSSSITSILRTIIDLGLLKFGKQIHSYVIRNGLDSDIYLGTSLVDMYAKNSSLINARTVLDNMKKRNIFSWNSLISGYSLNGFFDEALELLNHMEKEGIEPDLITWNSLISGYALWGHSKQALALIHQLEITGFSPNVVSWTALISGCSRNGNYEESLDFFNKMQRAEIEPNPATISSVLRACAGLAALQVGSELHCLSIRKGFDEDVFVATALIDMYSKSGNLKYAHRVFTKIPNKNLASWNTIIKGYGIHGLGKMAISLFDEMCELGMQADGITFTALLSACSYSGLIDDGWKIFDSMKINHSVVPTLEHYSCMVDLLGRAGYLDEALDFIEAMPLKPDASIWGSLLGACKIHKNLELGKFAAKYLFELEPYNSGNYLLMMNLYAMENRWEEVEDLREVMNVVGVKSRHGWSWIRIDRTVHVFSVEGKPHQHIGQIFFELFHLVEEIKKLGYLPDKTCVAQQVDEKEKVKLLLSHTEKLAITYGLIRTEQSSVPIRVIKNTRVCGDCHTAAKFISQVRCREIVLRDSVRFHHFSGGKCSCNDYW